MTTHFVLSILLCECLPFLPIEHKQNVVKRMKIKAMNILCKNLYAFRNGMYLFA